MKGGLRALMVGITLICAFVITACGNDMVTVAIPQSQYMQAGLPFKGSVESVWTEQAGNEIKSSGFTVDIDLKGPFHGPKPKGSNFSAISQFGTNCVAVFVEGMPNSDESLMTTLYIEQGSYMVPWAAQSGSEATASGANRLIAHFKNQCGA